MSRTIGRVPRSAFNVQGAKCRMQLTTCNVQRSACISLWVLLYVLLPSDVVGQLGDIELRGGVMGYFSQRSTTLDESAGSGSGTLAGIELAARSKFVGASARLFGGSFSAEVGDEAVGDIGRMDLSVLAGPSYISGELGYALRSFTGAFGTRRWSFVRLGGQSTLPLGTTGLHASVSAAVYLGVSASHNTGNGSGRDLETRLTYTASSLPLYAALGYRFERFTVDDATDTRPDEMSGVMLVVGVRLRL